MSIFREFNISMIPGKPPLIIHVSQYESDFVYTFHLVSGKSVLAIPNSAIAVIRGTKRDGNGYSVEAALDAENHKVVVMGDPQLTACAGKNVFELAIINDEKVICTANFFIDVERAPLDSDTIQSETVLHDLQAIINSAATATQAAEEASASAAAAAESARTLTIDPTLTQSGQAADAKVVGDRIEKKVSKPTSSPNGTAGQLLRTNGDGTTQWVEQGLPTDEQTAEAIDEWLTDHPEATTTVQDGAVTTAKLASGAVTEPKLADALKLKVIKDYVTPEMFGAVGDGIADDTSAIINMFASGFGSYLLDKKYAITAPINNVSGIVFGSGKILARNSTRISPGFFVINGDTFIEDITFNCLCYQEFIEEDYGTSYNSAIYSDGNAYDLIINNIHIINGYSSGLIYLHNVTGKINIKNSTFKAEGENNKWSGYMIAMQTIGGIDVIDIVGNRFYGNGNSTSNFSGIFMSNISLRKKINIGRNLFDGVGRNKTGGHQSHCIDAYWDVSHLNVFENVMINNAYCCLRIHGGEDFDIHDNYFGKVNALTSDACILVQDDESSTGLTPIGVSDVKIRNNVFETVEKYQSAIQFTSDGSNQAGEISDIVVQGNKIDGVYNQVFILDGSVKGINISNNTIKSINGGILLRGATYAFTNTSDIVIACNIFEIRGGSAIANTDNSGDIMLRIINNYFTTHGWAVTMKTATSKVFALNNAVIGSNGFNNVYLVGGNIIEISNINNGVVGSVRNYGNYVNGSLS